MKVRGKKLLAAMLSLAMVLSMFVVPASAADVTIGTKWEFMNSTFDGNAANSGAYEGLTFTNAGYNSNYGMALNGSGTVTVPVPGACNIKLVLGYSWNLTLGDEASEAAADAGHDKEVIFHHNSTEAAVITSTGSSYIKSITLEEYTAPQEPTYADVGDSWDFKSEESSKDKNGDPYQEQTSMIESDRFPNLTMTTVKYHSKPIGLEAHGSIAIAVARNCDIKVVVNNAWEVQLGEDATTKLDKASDPSTTELVFKYRGGKGTATLKMISKTYVESIELVAASTEPEEPTYAAIGTSWDFSSAESAKDKEGNAYVEQVSKIESDRFENLTMNNVKYHGTTYGVTMGNGGSIDIAVPGDCDIEVEVGYQWKLWLGDDEATEKTNPDNGTAKLTYHYKGEAGKATLKAKGTTYIKTIRLVEATAAEPTLVLDKTLVELKMDGKTSDTVTATVGNSTAAVKANSKDENVATASVNDKVITVTAAGAGDTIVEVTLEGVADLKKEINVHVDPAGEVTYTEWDFTAQSYQSHTTPGTDGNPDVYQTLSIVGGKFHGTKYGMTISNGTITIPVTGKCDINVTVGYTWELWLGDDSEHKASYPTGNGGEGNVFSFRYTGEADTAVLTIGNVATYIKFIELKPVADPADRKIDVWDLGGKVETSDDARYRFNITPADWVSAGTVTAGNFSDNGNTDFGELTITAKSGDRLYSTEASNAAFAAIVKSDGNTFDDAFDDGYKAVGAYYCNGAGDSNNRYLTLKGVSAGDKIAAYLGSSKDSVTFHFQGVTQDDTITRDKGISEVAAFVAQENGTYKIWSTSGKPLYYRIVRFPGVNVRGSIDIPAGFSATDYTVKFVNQTNKQETEAVVDKSAKTYTATLAPGFTYTVSLSGATGWGFSADTRTLTTTDAESMGDKTANLKMEAKPVFTYAGTITGFDDGFDATNLVITMIPADPTASDPVELTINADKTFTATLDAGMAYTLKMEGANDYAITAPAEVKLTANAAGQTITVEAKDLQTVSGKFLGLGEGVTVTALKFKNVEDSYEYTATVANGGYTAKLRAGAYEAVATVSGGGYTTISHVVVADKAVTKDLLFAAPADTSPLTWVKDVYVGHPDKENNYATVNDAVKAVARMGVSSEAKRVTIHIAPGTYREQVIINTPYITLTNDKAGEVLLTWYYGIGYMYYSSNGYYDAQRAFDKYEKKIADRWGTTVRVNASATGFRAEGITFENSFNRYVTDEEIADGVELVEHPENSTVVRAKGVDVTSKAATERAAAMCVETDQAEFFNCSFLSSQDTLYTAGDTKGCQGRMYFKNCYIEGQTDYIFGSGSVVFDECTLNWKGYSETNKDNPGYVTAVRPADTTGCKGYLFRDCTVTANPDLHVAPGYWGRTWGADAMATFLNTKLEKANLIVDEGWKSMNGDPKNANYHEFGTTTLDGAAVDTSKRVEGTVMTEAEANAVTAESYFNSWTPYYYGTETRTVTFQADTGANVTDLTENDEARVLNSRNQLVALKDAVVTFKIAVDEGYALTGVTGATWENDIYTVNADTVVISARSTSSSGGSGGNVPSSNGSKTQTVTNSDGSKTTTKTDRHGNVTVTTKAPDGSQVVAYTSKDGDKSITVTDAKGTVQAKVELPAVIPAPEEKFADVPEGHWAEESINRMAGLGTIQGIGGGNYDMNSPITRGSVATILYRLSNVEVDASKGAFTDVESGDWYAEAVAWASSTGVVTGYSESIFAPKDSIDRQQLAVMLYRYAKLLRLDTTTEANLKQFQDAADVADWAADAMSWCVGEGILKGNGYGSLNPAGTASRAECATMLDRFIGLL